MIKNKLRYKEIIAESYYLEENNKKVILFCAGIPGTSSYDEIAERYAKEGFIFIHPKYIGSWESYGDFSIGSCKDTIVTFVNALLTKNVKTVFGDKFDLKFEDIFILGHSFGGSVALCSGADLNVKGIIALAPVINYKKHAREKFEEERLDDLYDFISLGFENVYRNLNEDEWNEFCKTGLNLNADSYLEKLKNKRILLIHGVNDSSIHCSRSKEFYSVLKNFRGNVVYEETSDNHSNIKLNSLPKIISWTKQ